MDNTNLTSCGHHSPAHAIESQSFLGENRFCCTKCGLRWPIWYKASGKPKCKACDGWGSQKTRDRHEQDHDAWIKVSFWKSHLAERRRLAGERSLHVCGYCHKELPAGDMCKNGVECKKCKTKRTLDSRAIDEGIKEKRQDQRRRAASKQNKEYRTRDDWERECNLRKARRQFIALLRKHLKRIGGVQRSTPIRWPDSGVCWLWTKPGISRTECFRLRYRLDEAFAIKQRLRRQINKRIKKDAIAGLMRSALIRNGSSCMVESALGYSIADLRQHLERQFVKGMSWDEFRAGRIHIDHIVPQSSYDLLDGDEWRKCWCLSNLRPVWAGDNLAKSNKRLFLL